MKNSLAAFLFFIGMVLVGSGTMAAESDECYGCHDRQAFQGRVVHAPVKEGRCSLCHSPHVAKEKALLRATEAALCLQCHQKVGQAVAKSAYPHEPVARGNCVTCHAPHASSHPVLLAGNLSETCFSCHEESRRVYAVPHKPFAEGKCDGCHTSHGAADSRLIKAADPLLCLACHRDRERLKSRHLGRNPANLACLKCHSPHGGSQKTLLRTRQHQPFAQGQCRQCHEQPNRPSLCLQCHAEVLPSFQHSHSHLVGQAGGNICLSCHDAHAGDAAGMLPANQSGLCRSCHADTFKRRAGMLHRHPEWNTCSDCHQLHGSDHTAMLKGEVDAVCGQCHEKHVSFTHPVGEKARDPRNDLPMTCITCHDSNVGTLFKYHLRGGGERGLCIECHQSY